MQLVLDTNGLLVKIRNKSFWVTGKKINRQITPLKVDSIVVSADCMLSASAIRLAVKHGIPVYYTGRYGKTVAKLSSPHYGNIVTLRRKQVLFAESEDLIPWLVALLEEKYQNQLKALQSVDKMAFISDVDIEKAFKQLSQIQDQLLSIQSEALVTVRQKLLGIEGSLARIYWQTMASMMPDEWIFNGRSRRPASDIYNAALNYLYGMTYNLLDGAVMAAGLDPYLGFFHTDAYTRPTLVYDMIEPFRPWVDAFLADLIFSGELLPEYFQVLENGEGVRLGKKAKRILITGFHEYFNASIRYRHRQLSREKHIYRYIGEFGKKLSDWEYKKSKS